MFSVYSNSVGQFNEAGRKSEYFPKRIFGASGAWKNPFGSINQQLIDCLIERTFERLEEARNYAVWYEKQVNQLSEELKELEQLKQLAQGQPVSEEE